MDDLVNVEKRAQENNWFQLPTTAYGSNATTPHLRWRASGYAVNIWSFKPSNLPAASSGFVPIKMLIAMNFLKHFLLLSIGARIVST
jgi:hypothetical protein